jgi:hypothetical protein
MAKLVTTSYISSSGAGTAIFVQIRNPADGSILVSRTHSGVREDVTGSGFYVWSGTVSPSLEAYEAVWDNNGSGYGGEIVIPEPTLTVVSGSGTTPAVVGDANGTLAGLTFTIKRNDTLPYLRRQFFDTFGNIVPIDALDTVKFTMRASTDVTMGGSPKVHASAVIIDAANGVVEYRWAAGDTDTSTWVETSTLGRPTDTPYAAEFELTRNSDGKIETFPQGAYIAVSIPPDLDPGINP